MGAMRSMGHSRALSGLRFNCPVPYYGTIENLYQLQWVSVSYFKISFRNDTAMGCRDSSESRIKLRIVSQPTLGLHHVNVGEGWVV